MKQTTKRAEMREVLEAWESSGLSLRAFGERDGIGYAKLLSWKKLLRDGRSFAPVRIVEPNPTEAAEPSGAISIWLANGVSLEIPSAVDEAELSSLIRVLSAC